MTSTTLLNPPGTLSPGGARELVTWFAPQRLYGWQIMPRTTEYPGDQYTVDDEHGWANVLAVRPGSNGATLLYVEGAREWLSVAAGRQVWVRAQCVRGPR